MGLYRRRMSKYIAPLYGRFADLAYTSTNFDVTITDNRFTYKNKSSAGRNIYIYAQQKNPTTTVNNSNKSLGNVNVGDTVTYELKNIVCSDPTVTTGGLGLYAMDSTYLGGFAHNFSQAERYYKETRTLTTGGNIACLGLWTLQAHKTLSFDLNIYINGIKYTGV